MRDQQQRAGQARVAGGGVALRRRQRRRARRQRLRLAQVFGGERAVEVELRRRCRSSSSCACSRQRLAVLRIRAPAPAGRAPSSRPRSGRAARPALIASIACTTCCQRALPLSARSAARTFQASVSSGQLDLAAAPCRPGALGALELVGRLGQQLHRRLPGDAGPGPGGQVGAAARAPSGRSAAPAAARGRWRPGASSASVASSASARAAVAGLACRGSAPGCRRSRRRLGAAGGPISAGGLARGARPVRPRSRGAPSARRRSASSSLASTSVGGRAGRSRRRRRAAPARRRRAASRTSLAGEVLGEQRVAGDLAVVVHAKARELGGEVGPVAAPAELEQPVVAQPVLDVGAAPALAEAVELGLLRPREAVAQLPVVDPHRERIALGQRPARAARRGGRGRACATPRARRARCRLDAGAGAGAAPRRGQRGEEGGEQRERCQRRPAAGAPIY